MEKVDLSKGYWNPKRKLGVAVLFSEIISLEPQIKMSTIFSKEKEKIFSSQICLEFAVTYRNANTLITIFKLVWHEIFAGV